MKSFISDHDIVSCFVPIDLETAANTGDWVSLKYWNHLTVVLFKAAGTANDDPVMTFAQATVVAGTDTKSLLLPAGRPGITNYWYKQGALLATTAGCGTWTEVAQVAATTITTNATAAESQGIYVIDIYADQLDVNGGFDCVQMSVADTGAAGAQIGCAFYILSEPRVAAEVTASAIVD